VREESHLLEQCTRRSVLALGELRERLIDRLHDRLARPIEVLGLARAARFPEQAAQLDEDRIVGRRLARLVLADLRARRLLRRRGTERAQREPRNDDRAHVEPPPPGRNGRIPRLARPSDEAPRGLVRGNPCPLL
jgi:hypothetical protein